MSAALWTSERINALFEKPFNDLLFEAHTIHRQHFKTDEIQLSKLLSIKTGACPEDCAYCPQSGHYATGVEKEKIMALEKVVGQAEIAKKNGATRFCMGAAWRNPPEKQFPKVLEMIKAVKALGLETCVTLGMLDEKQAQQLKEAGLDFYNHNLDTSPDYYKKIISTRTYQDRLDTLQHVHNAGVNVCCGGILGLGETREDRVAFLLQLTQLAKPPQSVPINHLIPVRGTPLEKTAPLDNFEFIRTIAIARILMPTSYVRLSAGRESMPEEMQALCFFAGANSIFYGNEFFIFKNHTENKDALLLHKLGLKPQFVAMSA